MGEENLSEIVEVSRSLCTYCPEKQDEIFDCVLDHLCEENDIHECQSCYLERFTFGGG